MLGILVELVLSWLLIWFFERKHLSALGITPSRGRLFNLVIGIILSSLACSLYFLLATWFAQSTWILNNNYTWSKALSASGWVLQSVLFEELLFRGAILYLLIQRLSSFKACILSAIAFGIYHWFSQSAWGNPVQMIFIFLLTGIAGFVFAVSFASTKSLYLPIGLHFGWNFINIAIFSNGPLGEQLLIPGKMNPLNTEESLILFFYQIIVFPLMVWGYLRYLKNKPVEWALSNKNQ